MKMIYAPDPPLGIRSLQAPPVEVEVLEHGKNVSRVRRPLSENCIINIARSEAGKPLLKEVETEVLSEFLKPIQ